MQTYICLLRGINVGGNKKIKMADLKLAFENLGFTDVITYIQSGNIVFKFNTTALDKLEQKIHKILLDNFGFDIPVLVLTPEQIKIAATDNPFQKEKSKDPKKFYVIFLKNTPKQEDINTLATFDYSPEEYHLQDRIIFFYAANGAADAKMNNNFFENKLKVSCTTRNWNTVNKLVELSRLD